jgi:hypothetical protein
MSMMEMLLGQVRQHVDVDNLAGKVGLPAGQVEKAIAALAHEHSQPGDTVTTAAARTGIDTGIMGEIMNQVGGEGSIARYAQMLDRDGDGNPLNDIAGLAGGLLGKR